MAKHSQQQFLDVIDRDEAEVRFRSAIDLTPRGEESVPLTSALGRTLSQDVIAAVDVPSFDRSNFDGYAVLSADTFGAMEETPRRLSLVADPIATGTAPSCEITPGTAVGIATGGMIPRGADAIVMIEHADIDGDELVVTKASPAGFGITFAGTDIAAGQTVLYRSERLTSRETGVLAAIGLAEVTVERRVKVAIISTGNEIIAPGETMQPGLIYDSNAQILADAVRELDADPLVLGVVRDDVDALREHLRQGLETADVVLLSGGTSKGHGDLCYQVVAELNDPGIVAHGVALKPGKPICLASQGGKPVVVLPGFPTSAIFTFHEFVAPVIRILGGLPPETRSTISARMAMKMNSQIGRTEYMLVGLTHRENDTLVAYPMGKGSGSVTTFSHADGFITIDRHEEIVEVGTSVEVQLLSRDLRVADLTVIGSHCVGLDYLLSLLQQRGFQTKFFAVGSTAGLAAAERGECDLAGIHLLDQTTGDYNRPFLTDNLELITGYGRRQGIVFRRGDERFEGQTAEAAIATVREDKSCVMVNRNQGSGTRLLIDRLLDEARPTGYAVQASNHNAVAAAVAQGRADWGLTIAAVAKNHQLGFLPYQEEQYDFVVPKSRTDRGAVVALRELLTTEAVRKSLEARGFHL